MLLTLAKLSDDAVGLEKLLRFGQYASQAIAASFIPLSPGDAIEAAIPWRQAQAQFALTRRYFRLLKWHGTFSAAYTTATVEQPTLERTLRVCKFSFLGLYLFFEMFAITNAMKLTDYAWAAAMQHEALKFWLYAIVSSLLLGICLCFSAPSLPGGEAKATPAANNEKSDVAVQNAVPPPAVEYSKIYVQLAIDCADVLIPGAALGWVQLDDFYVGIAGTLSTLLALQELWRRVE